MGWAVVLADAKILQFVYMHYTFNSECTEWNTSYNKINWISILRKFNSYVFNDLISYRFVGSYFYFRKNT